MRILMYGWEFPPHISGGLGVACHGIVHGLLANQLDIALVLPDSAVPITSDILGLQIIQTPFPAWLLNPYSEGQLRSDLYAAAPHSSFVPPTYTQDILSLVQLYAATAGPIAKNTPHDVIHAHDWLTILAGIEARRVSNKPLVFHIHALEVDRCAEPINQAIFDIEKYGMQQADAVIAVSEYTKQRICQYYQIPDHKITVAYNGLFKEQIPNQPPNYAIAKYKTVLFLGRLTYQKGLFYFIETARKILQLRDDIQFVVAGNGDLFHSAIERIAALRLGSHIHFTSFLDRNEVKQIYQKSHVYVMPSVSEPFGLSCLEAVAHHIPVIISKQSGVSEVMQNTLKVDCWDTDKMANNILALIDHPALHKQLLDNSIPELYKLLWSNTVKQIMHVYAKITGT